MTLQLPANPADPPASLCCARCGYDLRMQPPDGICPECAMPVAESKAAPPVRPAWRDSDPRWRRRMLAGAWVMVLAPLIEVLLLSDLAASIPVATYDFEGYFVAALDSSLITMVFLYVAFCVGVVLFFAKERFRRRNPLDWTRRWGVIFTYLVLLLGIPYYAVVTSLVMIGIGALFITLPPENQPGVTGLLIELGSGYLAYGPYGDERLEAVLASFSAAVVLLACVPIFAALRSTGLRGLAFALVAPLVLAAVFNIAQAALYHFSTSLGGPPREPPPPFFFWPGTLFSDFRELDSLFRGNFALLKTFVPEAAKWLPFLAIAIWLSIAQAGARRNPPTRQPAAP